MTKPTSWKKVTLKRTASQCESLDEKVSAIIENTEYLGIDEDYLPSGESSYWNIYYLPELCTEALIQYFRELISEQNLPLEIMEPETVLKDNWASNWKDYFKPVKITENIVVVPEWLNDDSYQEKHKILITPGMAFGTGTHATTILCMQALEKHVDSRKINSNLLDIGCGTTILSILAVKLGVENALAFDLDPDVLENARDNIKINAVAPAALDLRVCSLDDVPHSPYDYIVCNMLSHEFLPILSSFGNYSKPGTVLIMSGLLTTEESQIVSRITELGFSPINVTHMDEWSCIVASYHES